MERFEGYLADFARRNKINTKKTYESVLRTFNEWIERRDKGNVFEDGDVLAFLDEQVTWSDVSRNMVLKAIKGWSKYERLRVPLGTTLEEIQQGRALEKRYDRLMAIKGYTITPSPKNALTIEQIKHLLGMMNRDTSVIFWILLWTGVRLNELKHLQFNFDENAVLVQTSKAGGFRTLFYDDYTKAFLEEANSEWGVFLWSGQKIWTKLKYYSIELPKEMKLTPHLCRHTFASHMVDRCSRDELRLMLGHSAYDTSGIYIHPEMGKIKELMTNRHYLKELESKVE